MISKPTNEPAGQIVDDAAEWVAFDDLPRAARRIIADAAFDYSTVMLSEVFYRCAGSYSIFQRVVADIDRAEHGKAFPGLYPAKAE